MSGNAKDGELLTDRTGLADRAGGRDLTQATEGLDASPLAVWSVAVSFLIMVRPSAINFFRLLPFLLPLFVFALHSASRSRVRISETLVPVSIVSTVIWFSVTSLWSPSKALSVADSVVLVTVTGSAVLIASRCTFRDFIGGIITGGLLIFGLSLAVAVVSPATGLVGGDYQTGALQGIVLSRNTLGFVLAISLTATLSYDFRGRLRRPQKIVLSALFVSGVVATSSSTALITAFVAISLSVVLAVVRHVHEERRILASVVALVTLVGLGLYAFAFQTELLALLDRNSSFTGRTQIWPVVEQLISERPLLGYGLGGVWAAGSSLREQINFAVGFETPHSHSGYLDTALQTGYIGLALLMLVAVTVLARGIVFQLRSRSVLSSWAPIFIVVLLIQNTVETTLMEPFTFFLLSATLVLLKRSIHNVVEPGLISQPKHLL